MVQLIKKGGLRERANRSRTYQGSENTEATLKPNRYQHTLPSVTPTNQNEEVTPSPFRQSLKHADDLDSK